MPHHWGDLSLLSLSRAVCRRGAATPTPAPSAGDKRQQTGRGPRRDNGVGGGGGWGACRLPRHGARRPAPPPAPPDPFRPTRQGLQLSKLPSAGARPNHPYGAGGADKNGQPLPPLPRVKRGVGLATARCPPGLAAPPRWQPSAASRHRLLTDSPPTAAATSPPPLQRLWRPLRRLQRRQRQGRPGG